MDVLDWLVDMHEPNNEGNWKHAFNLHIGTLINVPGWCIDLNLVNTPYEKIPFNAIEIERTDSDWISCVKTDGRLYCAGGVRNLKEMLVIIQKWMADKP